MWCCWISPGHNQASRQGRHRRVLNIGLRQSHEPKPKSSSAGVKLAWLFSADEADSEGAGSALATGEGAEIGGVEIVDYRVGILAA
jgi:hypothetical protein